MATVLDNMCWVLFNLVDMDSPKFRQGNLIIEDMVRNGEIYIDMETGIVECLDGTKFNISKYW